MAPKIIGNIQPRLSGEKETKEMAAGRAALYDAVCAVTSKKAKGLNESRFATPGPVVPKGQHAKKTTGNGPKGLKNDIPGIKGAKGLGASIYAVPSMVKKSSTGAIVKTTANMSIVWSPPQGSRATHKNSHAHKAGGGEARKAGGGPNARPDDSGKESRVPSAASVVLGVQTRIASTSSDVSNSHAGTFNSQPGISNSNSAPTDASPVPDAKSLAFVPINNPSIKVCFLVFHQHLFHRLWYPNPINNLHHLCPIRPRSSFSLKQDKIPPTMSSRVNSFALPAAGSGSNSINPEAAVFKPESAVFEPGTALRAPSDFMAQWYARQAERTSQLPRQIILKGVPDWANFTDILCLVSGGPIERIWSQNSNEVIVQFLYEADCEAYYDRYCYGIRIEDDLIEVEQRRCEPLSDELKAWVAAGTTRCVQVDIPDEKTFRELQDVAKDLNLDHLMYHAEPNKVSVLDLRA